MSTTTVKSKSKPSKTANATPVAPSFLLLDDGTYGLTDQSQTTLGAFYHMHPKGKVTVDGQARVVIFGKRKGSSEPSYYLRSPWGTSGVPYKGAKKSAPALDKLMAERAELDAQIAKLQAEQAAITPVVEQLRGIDRNVLEQALRMLKAG